MKKVTFNACFFLLATIPFLHTGCTDAANETTILPGACQIDQYLYLLKEKKIGLVANHTSLIGSTHLFDTLTTLGVKVKAIFSPEHGFRGTDDAGVFVVDEKVGTNSVSVISLYGKKKKPDSSDLKDIDVMIFDLQDVGVRFYTYLSTLHYVMEACAEFGVPLIVLDRPNPNGFFIDGPLLEKRYFSFVGMHPVPVVYGMSIGEYALMINGEYWLNDSAQCKLIVIPCSGYCHSSKYTLPVNPSPNLPAMQSVYLYPSLALFEGTVATVNKGTDFPFLMIGHPQYPGHKFSFIPISKAGSGMHPLYEGKTCYGIDLRSLSTDSISQLCKMDLKYLIHFYNTLQMGAGFFNDFFEKLAGTANLRIQIMEGRSEEEIRNTWQPGLEAHKKIRAKYLLYPDFNE